MPIYLLFLCLLISLALAGCNSGAQSFTQAELESHQQMLDWLARIEIESQTTNPYIGNAKLLENQKKLEQVTSATPTRTVFFILVDLADAEVSQGMDREAVDHLSQAMELVRNDRGLAGFEVADVVQAVALFSIAALNLAESENCAARPKPDSCIYPISENAVHKNRTGAEMAVVQLTRFLQGGVLTESQSGQAIWLLNLAYMVLGDHPEAVPPQWLVPNPLSQSLNSPANSMAPFPAFKNIAGEAGVDRFSLAGGAAADDFDGDGDIDIMVSSWDVSGKLALFKNDGTGHFTEFDTGLDGILGGLNLKQADYDNDGDLDVLVLRGAWLDDAGKHPNSLLKNDGTGRFVDVAIAVGIADEGFPTQTAEWTDYDLDGDLDLFVGNESSKSFSANSQLFRNDGGMFIDVSKETGILTTRRVKGVAWGDFDGDRYPDLLISSMGAPNQLYRNLGDGNFEDRSHMLGETGGPLRSFPTWFFDYNNDGWLDIFISAFQGSGLEHVNYYRGYSLPDGSLASLFRNEKGKAFTDVIRDVKLDRPMIPMGANYGDLTNNGYPDIYLGTGTPNFDSIFPNALYINDGGQFSDQTAPSRMGHLQKGHAVCFADFDNDGDLDVFEQMGGALPGDAYYDVLFDNPGFDRSWIKIALRGKKSNFYGVGARVGVLIDEPGIGERWIYQWMNSGASFGANPLTLHFGLGEAQSVKKVEVFWPVTGKTQTVPAPKANRQHMVYEE